MHSSKLACCKAFLTSHGAHNSLGAKPGIRRGKDLLSRTNTSDRTCYQGRGHIAATPLHTTPSFLTHISSTAFSHLFCNRSSCACAIVHMIQWELGFVTSSPLDCKQGSHSMTLQHARQQMLPSKDMETLPNKQKEQANS